MKDALAQLAKPRSVFADRMEIANQLAFWRGKRDQTTDPIRLASYQRIIADLTDIAERLEGTNV